MSTVALPPSPVRTVCLHSNTHESKKHSATSCSSWREVERHLTIFACACEHEKHVECSCGAEAYPVAETALGQRIWQLPGVHQILQVVADFFGRVNQDWEDKVVFIIIILTCIGSAEGTGPLACTSAVDRRSLCHALLLLHAEHQIIVHHVCWWRICEWRMQPVQSALSRMTYRQLSVNLWQPCWYVTTIALPHGCLTVHIAPYVDYVGVGTVSTNQKIQNQSNAPACGISLFEQTVFVILKTLLLKYSLQSNQYFSSKLAAHK